MSDRIKLLMSFRARLIMLLTSFLLLTIVLVLVLDNWARKRTDQEVRQQSEEVKAAVNSGFSDFQQATGIAIQNLDSTTFLYDLIEDGKIKLPPTVEHIVVADERGEVSDTTLPELKDKFIHVPDVKVTQEVEGDPIEGDIESHGGQLKTAFIPFTSDRGVYWIVIVTNPRFITSKIDDASKSLAMRTGELSNIRLLITAGLLVIALGIAVVIGWRFTRPINELAGAARRVAAGELDFKVNIERADEVGQLASTFNEMIAGLKAKIELEERLNQTERAAAIGRLTQAVAHEIRNPLNVINLSIDHVSTRYAPEDEARRKQFTRMLFSIKDEIARLKRLVSDLLNYGRPARLALETIDVRKLVDETIALIRPQADEQHVEITVEQDPSPAEVRGDRERLKSCLSNIAINALQAMPAGGRLDARVAKQDGSVVVSISDSGVGISEEAVGKIFEPYFSTKQTGFGLGLAVTKTIIEEHQGEIEVHSRVNEGTTFVVKLPAAEG
ncbi:MAG TPA: ATP-binding protein [Blastocatellia bacterium]|nr:ATP-binding protein [Blastocatellia bacterium]